MADEKQSISSDTDSAPVGDAGGRFDSAIPDMDSITPILELESPPIDPDLVSRYVDDGVRDYGPDPVAEFSLMTDAKGVFAPAAIGAALTADLRRVFDQPNFYVRMPSGRVVYMFSSDAPSQAVGLGAGWKLGRDSDVDRVATGAEELGKWLVSRPEGFSRWQVYRVAIAARHAHARRILSVVPNRIAIVVWPKKAGDLFNGKKVWRTLHGVGLDWGDGDQFHWLDQTGQTDDWFSAEVDDGRLGYALPGDIAAGRQHFVVIRFGFTIARTPHPLHVLQQMISAAQATALELDGQTALYADDAVVGGVEALATAVQGVVDELASLNVIPGSSSVCMLR